MGRGGRRGKDNWHSQASVGAQLMSTAFCTLGLAHHPCPLFPDGDRGLRQSIPLPQVTPRHS